MSLIILILAFTILVWLILFSALFGYRLMSVHGDSMQPSLYEGDAVLMRYTEFNKIEVGSIVTLQDPSKGWIIHRLINIEPYSNDTYYFKTRGDNNSCPEFWIISNDEKILMSHVRFIHIGYILDFLNTMPGRVILTLLVVSLVISTMIRRRRLKIE
ncbi:signal peptidase I [Chloroflexota bacterium]